MKKKSLARPKVIAIIQARMGSTRLPSKTMANIGDKPLLAHIIDRVKNSNIIDDIIVATTDKPEDVQITNFAKKYGIESFMGSTEDVLDRFYQAARTKSTGVIVRITSDDPFKDPRIIDKIATHLIERPELDYASNTIEPTYPEGLDIEVFRFKALEKAWLEAWLPSEREHVTPYIWKHPEIFNIANIKNEKDLSNLRWTIDFPEDLRFTREVYSRIKNKNNFHMEDILAILNNEPELSNINKNIERNYGYKLSIKKDKISSKI